MITAQGMRPLRLDGHRLTLTGLALDGTPLTSDRYTVDKESLTIPAVPAAFTLEVTTEIRPQDNTFLEGLYRSSGMFCTQCEAEGFRAITYFPDRPDVLAVYTATIVADRSSIRCFSPTAIRWRAANSPTAATLPPGMIPFPKPCYLFALVAGDLVCTEGQLHHLLRP